MAILTHKLLCTNYNKPEAFCVGVYDSFEIAQSAKQRNEVCFPRCRFEVVANR